MIVTTPPSMSRPIAGHEMSRSTLNDNSQLQAVRATQLAPTDDREVAIAPFLTPGNYTAVVRGKSDTTGVALVEAYRLP